MNKYIAIWMGLVLPFSALASEIVPVEQAFIPTVSINNNAVQIDFNIKEDYYMYQDKMSITPLDSTQLGVLEFSEAKMQDDPFFGRVNVYRNQANVQSPVLNAQDTIKVEIGFQGCWDGGVCYPPITQVHTLNYQMGDTAIIPSVNNSFSSATNRTNFFKSLNLEKNTQDPVKADEAFVLTTEQIDENMLRLTWDIRQDYYLYAEKFNFEISGGEFGEIDFPKGKPKQDDFFGMVDVYYDTLSVDVPIIANGEVMLTLTYQGCWEGGVCYPPLKKNLTFDFSTTAVDKALTSSDNPTRNTARAAPSDMMNSQSVIEATTNESATPLNAQDKITHLLKNSNFWVIIGAFFVFGLALSFTPCVLPMIPILSNIIIGQKDISKARAFLLSLVFVLAMAITYTLAGVMVSSLGINLIIWFQNPYVIVSFTLLFILLAFSMFGYFEFKMPNFISTKLSNISNNQKSGSTIGVAIMGLISAFIIGPCVAPPLAGSLLFISQTGDSVLGGAALFAMAMGMGIPLLIIGSGIGSLPKAGGWMDGVKHLFGVIMLGVGIWMLDKILSPDTIIILWALLLTIAPIALGATIAIHTNTSYMQRIYRGFLLIILGYGVVLLLLVARGGTSSGGTLLNPLQGVFTDNISTQMSTQAVKIDFKNVATQQDIDQALMATDKIVMLDFYADWCIYCKVYEQRIFPAAKVAPILANFELLKLDMTDYTNVHRDIMHKYDIFAPPVILFFQHGKELRSKRIVGELNTQEFYDHISAIIPNTKNNDTNDKK